MNELNCTKATRFLIENNMTISFMESCTSGLLASMLTDTEGASGIFKGSLVTYSNEMKIAAGVAAQTIERHGVYSSQCAKDMAQVCQNIYKTDIAIGITGTTGNVDPCNPDSVRGSAFFCIRIGKENHDYFIEEKVSHLTRKEIKQLYADRVYEKLVELLQKKTRPHEIQLP